MKSKKSLPLLSLSAWLLALGHRIGQWSENEGLMPKAFQFCLREKSRYVA